MELEVWGVGPEPDQEELGGDSVLNVDPEAQVRETISIHLIEPLDPFFS